MSTTLLAISLIIFVLAAPTTVLSDPRKLQETSAVTGDPNGDIKCGGCPACSTPCTQNPPELPPPPPSQSPPPPPSPKKPPTPSLNCPPPPSYIYISGPPGNLYPVDPYFSGATMNLMVGLPLIVGTGFLSIWTLL